MAAEVSADSVKPGTLTQFNLHSLAICRKLPPVT